MTDLEKFGLNAQKSLFEILVSRKAGTWAGLCAGLFPHQLSKVHPARQQGLERQTSTLKLLLLSLLRAQTVSDPQRCGEVSQETIKHRQK